MEFVILACILLGQDGNNEWQAMLIEWKQSRAKARLVNIGGGCFDLILSAEINSSNGVHSSSDFEVKLREDTPSYACESWRGDWTHPAPGSSFGHREGNEVVGQLKSELDRFIDPIVAGNVKVSLVR